MERTERFDPGEPGFARGQETEFPTTLEEEVEREREGHFSRGQEVLPEETIEKEREGSFARGQEETPEDTFEKVREGSFAEGQEEYPHEPEVVETDRDGPGNVPPRDDSGDSDIAI